MRLSSALDYSWLVASRGILRISALVAAFAPGLSACGGDGPSSSITGLGHGARGKSRDASTADSRVADASGGPNDPISMKPLEWVWVPFPDAKCRDGSIAGIEISAGPSSDDLVIYLEGGGSCWNPYECSGNPASVAPTLEMPNPQGPATGIFDRTNPVNPVRDWNMVYVPYCTGDLHAGNNPGFDPGGGAGPQEFVGYKNIEKFLDRLVPTFPNVKKVLHTGYSAGGYGALFTFELVKKKFPATADVLLVSDSSPSMSTTFLPACIQHQKWTTWGFDTTFLRECGADCPNPDDYLMDYPKHLVKAYPSARFGVIESIEDAVISAKFGYTAQDCGRTITQGPSPVSATTFRAGLLDYRAEMRALVPDGGKPTFGIFYLESTQHGWLTIGDSLYTAGAGGEHLVDWLRDILDGSAPTDVGP